MRNTKLQPKETSCNPQSSIHNLQFPNSPSARSDRRRQSAIERYENSCAHARC